MPGNEHRVVERINDGSFEMNTEFEIWSILDIVGVEEGDGSVYYEELLVECSEDWSMEILS